MIDQLSSGIKKFVRNTLRLSFSDLNYNIRIHEMIPCSEQLLGVEELISDVGCF